MQRALDLAGGFDHGPLFAHESFKRETRQPKPTESGGKKVWRKYKRAKPCWTTWGECAAFWTASAERTAATGVQHSVDHIVPLSHPLVCGLHCPANLRVVTLSDNIRKGNRVWPDMPGEQVTIDGHCGH